MGIRERKGTIGGNDVYLARWRPRPYQRIYRPVEAVGRFGEAQEVDRRVISWHIDSWAGGEGDDLYHTDRETYHRSTNVRPKKVGDGLVLGAAHATTNDDAATPATFNEGKILGFANGSLWAVRDDSIHEWQPATEDWDATGVATGAGGATATSFAQSDANNVLLALDNLTIREVDVVGGGSVTHYGTATGDDFVNNPVLVNFDGSIYALDGDDLYSIDLTTTNTRSQVVDVGGVSSDYLGTEILNVRRLSMSDKGPIWLQRTNNGQTFVWEYNVGNDVGSIIGRLPLDWAIPYSIAFAAGFVFVGFRNARAHSATGDAYIYFQRGSQRGVAGPVRSHSGSSASQPVSLFGTMGDDLLFHYDGAIWAYNLTAGGISQVAVVTANQGTPFSGAVFGSELFIAPVDDGTNANAVERFETESYVTTGTASLDSGRFDFDFPGISKVLLDITVVTDPLPADTSVQVAYSVDGGSFTTASGTHDTDDATSTTFTISTSASTVSGRDFELRLLPTSTAAGSTPTPRSVTARAMSLQSFREWILELDTGSSRDQESASVLDNLQNLKQASAVVAFSDPWFRNEEDADVSYDVVVEEVVFPDPDAAEEQEYATIRLKGVSLA